MVYHEFDKKKNAVPLSLIDIEQYVDDRMKDETGTESQLKEKRTEYTARVEHEIKLRIRNFDDRIADVEDGFKMALEAEYGTSFHPKKDMLYSICQEMNGDNYGPIEDSYSKIAKLLTTPIPDESLHQSLNKEAVQAFLEKKIIEDYRRVSRGIVYREILDIIDSGLLDDQVGIGG